jgi:UbiA prenyltransferase family
MTTANLSVALRLGRVSNLPTVWTNVVAGMVLAGGNPFSAELALVLAAMSAMYVGGMYLNDAFDREFDARERPERPIPAGQVEASTVFSAGFGLLAVGVLFLALAGAAAAVAGLALAAVIVYYDINHKNNPLSPLLMGICRTLVYVGAGLAVTVSLSPALPCAAVVVVCYLIGLTYIAKQETLSRAENLWPLLFLAVPFLYSLVALEPNPLSVLLFVAFLGWVAFALSFLFRTEGSVPRAVVSLIAGIALLDAIFIASEGYAPAALAAVGGFALTLLFQRFVPGT